MQPHLYDAYIRILHTELVPAMGCTEPIAIAFAAAKARAVLGCTPTRVEIWASGNIVKNVKSVVVPHTGGLRGIHAAAAAGIVAGDETRALEVLSHVTDADIPRMAAFLAKTDITVAELASKHVFDLNITLHSAEGTHACVQLRGGHTHIVRIEKDGVCVFSCDDVMQETVNDHSILNVADIIDFANTANLADVQGVLAQQIAYNTAIADEGLRGDWGANIGSVLRAAYGESVWNRAKYRAAAGSDARMSGCECPVVINSGSGNQGLTVSLPVIVYAEHLGASQEQLYRALIIANLVAVHLKTGIGCLSAYCGATSAGAGCGAGITYLYGGQYKEISHTIVNTLAINSGMICDGAKASCAAKIASAVEAGLLGMQMYQQGHQFRAGDGIVTKGVENTIRNVGHLAKEGMRATDQKIIDIMLKTV